MTIKNIMTDTDNKPATSEKKEKNEIKFISRHDSTWWEQKYLNFNPKEERVTSPALYRRKMVCKRIEQITRTDHDTYRVLIQRYCTENEHDYLALDCRTILAIEPYPDEPGTISFLFEEYYPEHVQASLHEAFLQGKYDDIGDCPEH